MPSLEDLLSTLDERHRRALRWFIDRTDTIQPWPVSDDLLLASKAKGIYKPSWTEYALSVRQTLDGPYADRPPAVREDGSWHFEYFQENEDPAERDAEYTNRGLLACWRDRVPVGVLRQVRRNPSRYNVLGVAVVTGWNDGYFHLDGPTDGQIIRDPGVSYEFDELGRQAEETVTQEGEFDAGDLHDARERMLRAIVHRRGQPAFRNALLHLYGGRCAFTECNATGALEAAHIVPYLGERTNHPSNGLLLRADVHLLFDLGLLGVETKGWTIIASPSLGETAYKELHGRPVSLPSTDLKPSASALNTHRTTHGL